MSYISEEIGEVNGRVFVDSAPVMDKVWAKKVFDKSKAYYHAVSRNSIAELFND